MERWHIIVFRNPLQAERHIVPRANPLGRIDGAVLHCWEDFRRRQHLRGRTKASQHLTAQPGDTDLEAAQIFDRIQR